MQLLFSIGRRRFIAFAVWIVLVSFLAGCGEPGTVLMPADSALPESFDSFYDFSEGEISGIAVDISGAVMCPGVYYLRDGIRVYEAVNLAGGLKEGAYTDGMNLVAELKDGDRLLVPFVGDGGDGADGRININTADVNGLCMLSGIGESKARAIIEYRNTNGNFTDPAQLMNVSGIGQGTYDRIKNMVRIQ